MRSPRFATRTGRARTLVPRTRGLVAALGALGLTAGLVACAGDVPMDAAEGANDPACADVTVRLPDTVADLGQRTTNAQATGAWGDPAGVLLRCGIEPSGPTTDECVNVNGVDWIIDRSNSPLYRFEPYGRTPGIEVIVDSELASGTATVVDLGNVVEMLPQERQCTSLSEELALD